MASWFCMLIGDDVISEIISSDEEFGQLIGFRNDGVFGAMGADVGKDENFVSKSLSTLIKHRFFKSSSFQEPETAFWVTVRSGFREQLEEIGFELDTLKEWIPDALYQKCDVTDEIYILFVEKDTKKVSSVRIFKLGEGKAILKGEVTQLEINRDPFKRIHGLVPLKELNQKKVAIVGLGSGGSPIAMELAAVGIRSLYLFDKDRLTPDNLFRHLCGLNDLGRKKVDAVEDVIRDHAIDISVTKGSDDIVFKPGELVKVMPEIDLIICATDNPSSRAMVNYLAVMFDKPLVLGCTYDNAKIGEIIRVIPRKTACYECTRIYLKENGSLETGQDRNRLLPYGSQSDLVDNETSRGTRTDVFIVAAMTTKVALMTLTSCTEPNFGVAPYNYITWGALRNTEYSDPFRFKQPFGTNGLNLNVHPECPICGNVSEELMGLDIEEKYNEIIRTLSK